VVAETLADIGDCLKTSMWVLRKSRNLAAVIHPPPIDSLKVHADVSTFK
jgi:hypothetical protein